MRRVSRPIIGIGNHSMLAEIFRATILLVDDPGSHKPMRDSVDLLGGRLYGWETVTSPDPDLEEPLFSGVHIYLPSAAVGSSFVIDSQARSSASSTAISVSRPSKAGAAFMSLMILATVAALPA